MSKHTAHGRVRVAVTGLGALTPVGLSAEETWQGLVAGRSGTGHITQFDPSGYPCRVAGEVKGFDARNHMDAKEARRMARFSQLAVAAAREALADAGLSVEGDERARLGVLIGTCVGGFSDIESATRLLIEKGASRVSPFFVTAMMHNAPAGQISRAFGLTGYNSTVTTACAAP